MAVLAAGKTLLFNLIELAKRWPFLIALFSFASGAASYFLIERSESLAQVLAVVMLISWVMLLLDNWIRAGFLKRFGLDLPPVFMHYITQMVHQESFFFALPFFLVVTSWGHVQAIFTALLMLCALVSVLDPIYYQKLAPRRALFVIFHAFALFAILLVALPVILHLTTTQSLALALMMALLFSLPSLIHFVRNGHWRRFPILSLMLALLALGLWQSRSWIPPAALNLTEIHLSQQMNQAERSPGRHIKVIDADSLISQGLYAWTAVRAPRGLHEQIHHIWLQNGEEVDRINLDIEGGREEGYRAWTHKNNFPADPTGKWQVRVVTDSGQLIGMTRFTVTQSTVGNPTVSVAPADIDPIE